MRLSSIFIPRLLSVPLPNVPKEFETMVPRRISSGDIFDAEVQITEDQDFPVYAGDILRCTYKNKELILDTMISQDMEWGDWVLTDLSVSPAADTTTEVQGIVIPYQWKLNGISVNTANATHAKGAIPIKLMVPMLSPVYFR